MAKKKTQESSGNMLTDLCREILVDEGLSEDSFTPNYSTGNKLVDYYNGRVENNEIVAGVDGGKIITIIGKSGSGKTTFGIQCASNIVNNYEHGQVLHLDFENATTPARIQTLTGWDRETINAKYLHVTKGLSSEKLYSLIKATANIKLSEDNYDKLKIDSGKLNRLGEPIYTLPPTVILIDSWASVIPSDIASEEELSGQMAATAIAKTNNAIIKRTTSLCYEANIIMIVINHITTKIEIGRNY